jgi:hypothetical protein
MTLTVVLCEQEVKSRIQRELQYQSDLELSNDAFEMV